MSKRDFKPGPQAWNDQGAICPHCGCVHRDDLPQQEDGATWNCDDCGKPFVIEVAYVVFYRTKTAEAMP